MLMHWFHSVHIWRGAAADDDGADADADADADATVAADDATDDDEYLLA